MKQRFFMFSLFVLLFASFVRAQETRTKVYAIAGAPDGAVGEYETPDQLKVLDEFIQSKYLEKYDQALLTNDKAALNNMIADHAVWVSERFGKGEHLDKAGVLATFGDKKVVSVTVHVRDHVRLRAMGPDEVLMTGNSSSVLTLQGKQSQTNRLFAQIYKKIDGRWQCTLHSIMDYDGLLPGSKP